MVLCNDEIGFVRTLVTTMLSLLTHPLSLHHASYVGLYLLLGGSGVYAPVPEEFTLLTAGFLIARGAMNPFIVLAVAITAALVFDTVLYVLARSGVRYAVALRDKAFANGFEKTRIFSVNHPLRTVFFLRFFMGFRLIGPLYAGFNKIPWPKFALATLASIGIYFPFVLSVGYFFHRSLPFILRIFRVLHVYLLLLLVVVVLGILAWYLARAWKRDVLSK